MTEQQEAVFSPAEEMALNEAPGPGMAGPPVPEVGPSSPLEAEVAPAEGVSAEGNWHAEAGRKGAHRVHQLIEEGKLYEQEHGLKRGRQRLRQLIELGKLYEQEHGLRPRKRPGSRLPRMEREELLATLLQCLLRLAKPSFRAELARLVEALQEEKKGHAA